MHEVWLRPNRRALYFALLPAGIPLALAAWMWFLNPEQAAPLWRALFWIMAGVGVVLIVGIVGQLRTPRIAYLDGKVLFYVRAGAPVAVPVEVVEAFFLGQGPAHHSAPSGRSSREETSNLVARLSQTQPEWARVDVKAALAQWCDGYVTIRGTWCEPLTGELVRTLNRNLSEASRSVAAESAATTSEAQSSP